MSEEKQEGDGFVHASSIDLAIGLSNSGGAIERAVVLAVEALKANPTSAREALCRVAEVAFAVGWARGRTAVAP